MNNLPADNTPEDDTPEIESLIMQRLQEVAKEHDEFLHQVNFRCVEALATVGEQDRREAWQRVHAFIEEYSR